MEEMLRSLKPRRDLRKAKELFMKVVREDKEHSLACYRLGFLYYYEENLEASALHFQKALLRSARYPQHKITEEQMVRAYCYHARACINLSRQSIERGNSLWRALPAVKRDKFKQLVLAT